MSKNLSANHKDSCNASSRSELACDYVLPATSGYTRLKDLEGNTLFNIVGVIKHFQGAKPVNGGRNFMTVSFQMIPRSERVELVMEYTNTNGLCFN